MNDNKLNYEKIFQNYKESMKSLNSEKAKMFKEFIDTENSLRTQISNLNSNIFIQKNINESQNKEIINLNQQKEKQNIEINKLEKEKEKIEKEKEKEINELKKEKERNKKIYDEQQQIIENLKINIRNNAENKQKEDKNINEKIEGYTEIIKNLKKDKSYLEELLRRQNIEILNLKTEKEELQKKTKQKEKKMEKDTRNKQEVYEKLLDNIGKISAAAVPTKTLNVSNLEKNKQEIDKTNKRIDKIKEIRRDRYYDEMAKEASEHDKKEKEKEEKEKEELKKEEREKNIDYFIENTDPDIVIQNQISKEEEKKKEKEKEEIKKDSEFLKEEKKRREKEKNTVYTLEKERQDEIIELQDEDLQDRNKKLKEEQEEIEQDLNFLPNQEEIINEAIQDIEKEKKEKEKQELKAIEEEEKKEKEGFAEDYEFLEQIIEEERNNDPYYDIYNEYQLKVELEKLKKLQNKTKKIYENIIKKKEEYEKKEKEKKEIDEKEKEELGEIYKTLEEEIEEERKKENEKINKLKKKLDYLEKRINGIEDIFIEKQISDEILKEIEEEYIKENGISKNELNNIVNILNKENEERDIDREQWLTSDEHKDYVFQKEEELKRKKEQEEQEQQQKEQDQGLDEYLAETFKKEREEKITQDRINDAIYYETSRETGQLDFTDKDIIAIDNLINKRIKKKFKKIKGDETENNLRLNIINQMINSIKKDQKYSRYKPFQKILNILVEDVHRNIKKDTTLIKKQYTEYNNNVGIIKQINKEIDEHNIKREKINEQLDNINNIIDYKNKINNQIILNNEINKRENIDNQIIEENRNKELKLLNYHIDKLNEANININKIKLDEIEKKDNDKKKLDVLYLFEIRKKKLIDNIENDKKLTQLQKTDLINKLNLDLEKIINKLFLKHGKTKSKEELEYLFEDEINYLLKFTPNYMGYDVNEYVDTNKYELNMLNKQIKDGLDELNKNKNMIIEKLNDPNIKINKITEESIKNIIENNKQMNNILNENEKKIYEYSEKIYEIFKKNKKLKKSGKEEDKQLEYINPFKTDSNSIDRIQYLYPSIDTNTIKEIVKKNENDFDKSVIEIGNLNKQKNEQNKNTNKKTKKRTYNEFNNFKDKLNYVIEKNQKIEEIKPNEKPEMTDDSFQKDLDKVLKQNQELLENNKKLEENKENLNKIQLDTEDLNMQKALKDDIEKNQKNKEKLEDNKENKNIINSSTENLNEIKLDTDEINAQEAIESDIENQNNKILKDNKENKNIINSSTENLNEKDNNLNEKDVDNLDLLNNLTLSFPTVNKNQIAEIFKQNNYDIDKTIKEITELVKIKNESINDNNLNEKDDKTKSKEKLDDKTKLKKSKIEDDSYIISLDSYKTLITEAYNLDMIMEILTYDDLNQIYNELKNHNYEFHNDVFGLKKLNLIKILNNIINDENNKINNNYIENIKNNKQEYFNNEITKEIRNYENSVLRILYNIILMGAYNINYNDIEKYIHNIDYFNQYKIDNIEIGLLSVLTLLNDVRGRESIFKNIKTNKYIEQDFAEITIKQLQKIYEIITKYLYRLEKEALHAIDLKKKKIKPDKNNLVKSDEYTKIKDFKDFINTIFKLTNERINKYYESAHIAKIENPYKRVRKTKYKPIEYFKPYDYKKIDDKTNHEITREYTNEFLKNNPRIKEEANETVEDLINSKINNYNKNIIEENENAETKNIKIIDKLINNNDQILLNNSKYDKLKKIKNKIEYEKQKNILDKENLEYKYKLTKIYNDLFKNYVIIIKKIENLLNKTDKNKIPKYKPEIKKINEDFKEIKKIQNKIDIIKNENKNIKKSMGLNLIKDIKPFMKKDESSQNKKDYFNTFSFSDGFTQTLIKRNEYWKIYENITLQQDKEKIIKNLKEYLELLKKNNKPHITKDQVINKIEEDINNYLKEQSEINKTDLSYYERYTINNHDKTIFYDGNYKKIYEGIMNPSNKKYMLSDAKKYFDDLGKKYSKSLERQTVKNLLKKYIDENKDNKIETKIEENLKTEENKIIEPELEKNLNIDEIRSKNEIIQEFKSPKTKQFNRQKKKRDQDVSESIDELEGRMIDNDEYERRKANQKKIKKNNAKVKQIESAYNNLKKIIKTKNIEDENDEQNDEQNVEQFVREKVDELNEYRIKEQEKEERKKLRRQKREEEEEKLEIEKKKKKIEKAEDNKKLRELLEGIPSKSLKEKKEMLEKITGGKNPRAYMQALYYNEPYYWQVIGKRSHTDIKRFNDLNENDKEILNKALEDEKQLDENESKRYEDLKIMNFTVEDYARYLQNPQNFQD